jgi:hypothetical protein
MRSDKSRSGVDVEQVRAKLLARINFEQVHAELMAALDGMQPARITATLLRSRGLGRRSRFLMQYRGRSNSSMSHLSRMISRL